MLWVVTFSVILPSLTSSAVVWAKPSAGQNRSSAAHTQIAFMIGLLWLQFKMPQVLLKDSHSWMSASVLLKLSGHPRVAVLPTKLTNDPSRGRSSKSLATSGTAGSPNEP